MRNSVFLAAVLSLLATAPGSAEAIPPMPDFPYVNTVFLDDVTAKPPQLIAAAKAVIDQWAAWKQDKGPRVIFKDWANARAGLIVVPDRDPGFADAKRLAWQLDKVGEDIAFAEIRDKKTAPVVASADPAEKAAPAVPDTIAARKSFAVEYERELLRRHMDVTVSAAGGEARTLRIKYVLASKPMVFNMTEDSDLMDRFRGRGFKTMVVFDGFDKTWTVDLYSRR